MIPVERPVFDYETHALPEERLVDLYKGMLLPRMIEEKMLLFLRKGKVTKWFSGIGQEAISTAVTQAAKDDEIIFPMHRNLGVFVNRGIPLNRLFAQWMGKPSGYTNGRDRSFHFGTLEHNIVGMISHLGPQLSLACGVGLASRLKKGKKVAFAFTGEGGTSQGEFHEALNVAAVWHLPVLFIIENNGYGLSTPVREQYLCERLADRGIGYGMEAHTIDGNNVAEVFTTVDKLANSMRDLPRPVLLECMTFRRRGHEEASGTKYVPEELMAHWEKRDPVLNFEKYLLEAGIVTEDEVAGFKSANKELIEREWKIAENAPVLDVSREREAGDVYSAPNIPLPESRTPSKKLRFVDAISDGLRTAMATHDDLVLMGQDIAEYGGVFKVTEGFTEEFGVERVRNTPLCESAIIGTAVGLTFEGFKAMVEMQFADFVTCGFNQIVNNAAKMHYRWGHPVNIVIRMPTGGGVAAGPFHSQSNEAWFFHTPGLKVVYPSTPEDAKGLLLASFEDPNPVMFFEHKALYRNLSSDVPGGYYTTPIGQARTVRSGNDVAIITYGMGVQWALRAVEEANLDAEILDLRTLLPLDYGSIDAAVKKANKVLIVHEDTLTGGIGAEIAAYITENLFEHLDAPVIRVASLDTPVPFSPELEAQFMASNQLKDNLLRLIAY